MAGTDARDLSALRRELLRGLVIPAHPLALTEKRTLDERRQVALTRYYCDAGAGGLAVGVHTTQFAIRVLGQGALYGTDATFLPDDCHAVPARDRGVTHARHAPVMPAVRHGLPDIEPARRTPRGMVFAGSAQRPTKRVWLFTTTRRCRPSSRFRRQSAESRRTCSG